MPDIPVLGVVLAILALAGAVVGVTSATTRRAAFSLGVVAVAAAGLVGIFANAPLVAAGLVLLQGGVVVAVCLVDHMVAAEDQSSSAQTSSISRSRFLGVCTGAAMVVVLGFILLTPGASVSASVDAAPLTDLLSRRLLLPFSVIGFVLLTAILAIVESNRPDDPAAGEDR